MQRSNILAPVAAFLVLLASGIAFAAPFLDLPDGSKLDMGVSCPVCNMKLEAGKIGPAAIVFKDGKVTGFDSPGDLFRFLFVPENYKFDPAEIKSIYVSEHGTAKIIDAKTAFYVVGREIQPGMGPDAAPFASKEAAEKFKTEIGARAVLSYNQVSLEDLQTKKKLKMDHGH